jgi:hypothetical protein
MAEAELGRRPSLVHLGLNHGETTRTQISGWATGSRRRSLIAWAAVVAILVLGWGAYAGTLLSLVGFDLEWRGIVCGGEYLPASCAPKSGWRKSEIIITLAQLVVFPILTFKGVRSASGAWFNRGWMLWLAAALLICIAVAPLNNPYLSYLP